MLALYLSFLQNDDDKKLITEAYNLYWRKMIAAAFNVTHNQELAEEAVHESFLKIVDEPEKLRAVAPERWAVWLTVVAANAARDLLRKESFYILPQNDFFWQQQPTNDKFEEKTFLLDEIRSLPDKYSEPLTLCYIYGYHISEIAEILQISPENVRQRLSRARKMLRKQLNDKF